jgi:hypothetical protein
VRGAGDAEVDEVREVARADQDVRRFDVPVHQPDPVRGIEGRGDLLDDRDGAARLETAGGLAQDEVEVAALDEAHVDEQPAVDLPEAVDGDDVRIAQLGREMRLATEPRLEVGVRGHVGREDFDSDHPLGLRVVGAEDLSHRAAAQQALQPVPPERGCAVHPLAPVHAAHPIGAAHGR